MKHRLLLLLCTLFSLASSAQTTPFRFAFLSDTHIGSPSGLSEEDLRRTVADINRQTGIAFVVVTGDITELGTDRELALAKRILDSLNVPWFVVPGNHDTGWSESGGLSVTKVFGYDRFSFDHGGIRFIGCASGPYVRMSDGHVPRGHVNWLKKELAKVPKGQPVVFLNHYPLDNGLDNWYEVVDALKEHNTVLALCGHGHSNRPVKAEEIPAVMGRSNLRAKEAEGGYNLVDVRTDSFLFTERRPLSGNEKTWMRVAFREQRYDRTKSFPRPDFTVNTRYPQVRARWTVASAANIISTPAVVDDRLVVVGNQDGMMEAHDLASGKRKWTFATGGPIFSSPAAAPGRLVFGSADGYIYCLSTKGKLLWKTAAGAAVLGSPLVHEGTVYIGASDGRFRALDLATGALRWSYDSLQGPVTGMPAVRDRLLVFGAWDRHLYALDLDRKGLAWKWSTGSTVINYSPAACTPVITDSTVYVVAPDRYLSAIDRATGATLWRSNESTVRESIGASADGRWIYGKTMQDTIVAVAAGREKVPAAWKLHAGFGYEHVPSMLVEAEGILYFGTRNGVVYAVDPATRSVRWAHKIDNSMVNTVRVLPGRRLLVSTMDGRLCLLEEK
ncbi:PQQ-binding-like beta-propeller repeat protein [Flaviaesturariibacter amylovorans]|uniref:PQQ-binding-like beta-propeller repeat protein n=1 Tax=Flaviaesturariibacter amylovorans TaxID=1084520 RepID=A0ABP8GLN0_9BACT